MFKIIELIGFLWPFERGRTRFFNLLFTSHFGRSLLNKIPATSDMKRGFRLKTRHNEYLSLWIRLYKSYESSSIKILQKELQKGGTFLDIGANLGLFSLDLAKNTDCFVIAFEPNPITAEKMRESIKINELEEKIFLREAAVGSEKAELKFLDNAENAGDSALLKERNSWKEGNITMVEVIALDDDSEIQSQISQVPPIRAIKMDIQGAELSALMGMQNLIKKFKPIMLIEVSEESLLEFDTTKAKLLSYIKLLGYNPIIEMDGNILFKPYLN